jgi:predicted TIM-barrel fold metal-dependent hydrolase
MTDRPPPPTVPGAHVTVIDAHVHVWPHGLVHASQRTPEPLVADPADLLATLDASGVAAALGSPAGVYPDNGYVLGVAHTVPRRFGAVVGISPRDPASIGTIPGHAAAGAYAVRVNLGAQPLEGSGELAGLDALADATAAAGLVLQWTMRLPSSALIERVAARHPALPQVFDHLGLPVDATDLGQLGRVRALAAIPGLHIKLSGMYALSTDGYPYEDVWPWAEGVVEAFGPSRTLWASDWPLSMESASHADLLALVRRLPFLDDTARAAILGETARMLWPRLS